VGREVRRLGTLLFWVAVAVFLPVVVAMVFMHLSVILEHVDSFVGRLGRRRQARPPGQSIERLAADLHRLAVHLDTVERSDELHRMARLRAASLAYDDVLRSACRTLELEVPDRTPLDPVERLETEAALAQKGLVW
jgi:hypothetical protein